MSVFMMLQAKGDAACVAQPRVQISRPVDTPDQF
jgi:hypothetical protein